MSQLKDALQRLILQQAAEQKPNQQARIGYVTQINDDGTIGVLVDGRGITANCKYPVVQSQQVIVFPTGNTFNAAPTRPGVTPATFEQPPYFTGGRNPICTALLVTNLEGGAKTGDWLFQQFGDNNIYDFTSGCASFFGFGTGGNTLQGFAFSPNGDYFAVWVLQLTKFVVYICKCGTKLSAPKNAAPIAPNNLIFALDPGYFQVLTKTDPLTIVGQDYGAGSQHIIFSGPVAIGNFGPFAFAVDNQGNAYWVESDLAWSTPPTVPPGPVGGNTGSGFGTATFYKLAKNSKIRTSTNVWHGNQFVAPVVTSTGGGLVATNGTLWWQGLGAGPGPFVQGFYYGGSGYINLFDVPNSRTWTWNPHGYTTEPASSQSPPGTEYLTDSYSLNLTDQAYTGDNPILNFEKDVLGYILINSSSTPFSYSPSSGPMKLIPQIGNNLAYPVCVSGAGYNFAILGSAQFMLPGGGNLLQKLYLTAVILMAARPGSTSILLSPIVGATQPGEIGVTLLSDAFKVLAFGLNNVDFSGGPVPDESNIVVYAPSINVSQAGAIYLVDATESVIDPNTGNLISCNPKVRLAVRNVGNPVTIPSPIQAAYKKVSPGFIDADAIRLFATTVNQAGHAPPAQIGFASGNLRFPTLHLFK